MIIIFYSKYILIIYWRPSIYSEDDLRDADLETPSFNVVTDTNDPNFPTHYTASIADLGNNKTAYVNTPFTKQDSTGQYRLLKMKATGEVEYTREPSASYSLSNIVSYADVTLSHLRSFSGEVFKAKVYTDQYYLVLTTLNY